MRIVYPYNENLPKRAAHDVYIMHQCQALAKTGVQVSLLCGSGSFDDSQLHAHYKTTPHFQIERLPLLRKSTFLNLSWNLPFFFLTQRRLEVLRPDFVFLSVLKQGAYHLQRKIPGVRYIYEIHELQAYPQTPFDPALLEMEKRMLARADLITVSTEALKEILQRAPYSLKVPIVVIPLAVPSTPLRSPPRIQPLTVCYVGQLYPQQGIPLLLKALALAPSIRLRIVGGSLDEISPLCILAEKWKVRSRVDFLGFYPPSQLPPLIEKTQAFVAPFEKVERMPYVAHTKLLEYTEWGRPLIAPDLPVVHEHFPQKKGILLFEPGNAHSLAASLSALTDEKRLQRLQQEIATLSGSFSWKKRAALYRAHLESMLSPRDGDPLLQSPRQTSALSPASR